MNKTRIKEKVPINDSTIFGLCDSGCVFTAKCTGSVNVTAREKTLKTKSGAEYTVLQKEYGLLIVKSDTDVTFESFEKVEYYKALFFFHGPYGIEKEYQIENISPIRIDLDGDWSFSISTEDGEKLCRLHEETQVGMTYSRFAQ